MPLDREERRRRQAIDRDPANKCKWESGCGNTARRGEPYCGAHAEAFAQIAADNDEIASLHARVYALPEDNPEREILSDIVGRIEVLFHKVRGN